MTMASTSLSVASPSPSLLRRPRSSARSRRSAATVRCASWTDEIGEASSSDFLRFRSRKGGEGGELQTAIVSYRKRFPWSLLRPFLQVDLVSTIHIADKKYFEILETVLEPYDCVLYEMVASRESLENRKNGTPRKRPKESRSKGFNIIGFIQRQMASVLSLDFQLDCLDYQNEKWFHADLDYETFKSLQVERGESFFTFARDVTLRSTKSLVQPSIPENLDPLRSKLLWASRVVPMPLLGLLIIGSVCAPLDEEVMKNPELQALTRLDFGAAMKIFLARRLTTGFTQITEALDEESIIIGERNRVATEALQVAIDTGKNRIAVLYGGGHMPDLDRRLREEFDMVPSAVQWVTAWSIKNRKISSNSFPLLKRFAEWSGWPLNRYQTLALLILSSVLAVDLCFWELFFGTAVNWASGISTELTSIYIDHLRFL